MTREPDCGHLGLIVSGEARGLCPLCQRIEIARLRASHSWQNICLAHQGDTQPCATPCLHCSRISAALERKP